MSFLHINMRHCEGSAPLGGGDRDIWLNGHCYTHAGQKRMEFLFENYGGAAARRSTSDPWKSILVLARASGSWHLDQAHISWTRSIQNSWFMHRRLSRGGRLYINQTQIDLKPQAIGMKKIKGRRKHT